jgi:hypothetical protein
MKYELQQRMRGAHLSPEDDWEAYDTGGSIEALRRAKRSLERFAGQAHEYRIVEVKPDPAAPARPTIEEKHAAELAKLAESIKRWSAKAKRAATTLKKLRARKRRLDRLYRDSNEPA